MSEAIFDMRPVSSLATYLNGYPFKPEDHDVEGVPVVRIAQLNDPTAEMDYFKGDVPKRNHIDDGDLIFSWSGSLCVRVWDRGPAYLNQHLFNVLPAEGVDKRWLKWILTHAIEHFHPYMHGSAMTHITKPMMTAVRVPTPSIEEQRRIADFLDDQVGRIDQAIEHINAQRVLLTEARLAQVNELTSHINGERLRMKWLFSESDERIGHEPDARELLSVSIHRGVVPRHEISEDEARADSLANYKVVRKGDLVLNRMRAFQGGVGVAYVQGVCSPDYAVLRPSGEISSAYLHYVVRSQWFVSEMTSRLKGIGSVSQGAVRTPRINVEDLSEILVVKPSRADQEFLVRTCKALEDQEGELSTCLLRMGELLGDRKRSLITAAVTGQLEVTVARPLTGPWVSKFASTSVEESAMGTGVAL